MLENNQKNLHLVKQQRIINGDEFNVKHPTLMCINTQ